MMSSKPRHGAGDPNTKLMMADGLKKASSQKKPPPSSKASNESTKPTRSSHARNITQNQISSKPISPSPTSVKTQVRNLSLKPLSPCMKKNSGVGLHPAMNLSRATFSSTIKDRKPDGPSSMKICTYTYCSLHGQKQQLLPLPALKCFLSARRQSLETISSAKNKSRNHAEPVEDEIHSKPQQDEAGFVNIDQLQESFSVTSFDDCGDENSEISLEETRAFDECVRHNDDDSNGSFELPKSPKRSGEAVQVQHTKQEQDAKANVETSSYDTAESEGEDVTNSASFISEKPLAELTNKPKAKYSIMRRQPTEKVRLRHQAVEERKAAEEWMTDYALRKALGRMAPGRKRKVAQLVAAFESVMPQKSRDSTVTSPKQEQFEIDVVQLNLF